jgi:facilitated trehalose transporter
MLPIGFAIAMIFIPESPRYLLSSGKRDKASANLQWLRGAPSPSDIDHELKEVSIQARIFIQRVIV